jgi:hypothetical protein
MELREAVRRAGALEHHQPFPSGAAIPVLASKADEDGKLDALRRSGALTQDELDREKAKLLGTPPTPPA